MDEQTRIIRGRQAAELMEHPLLTEAFDVITQRIKEEWERSPARDAEGREKLWLMNKLLMNLKQHIAQMATTGDLTKLNIQQKESWLKKLSDWAID